MRIFTVTLSLTLGGAIALCAGARAEEVRTNVIFTGVVPSTCALSMPTPVLSDVSSDPTAAPAVQVVCNDTTQMDSRVYNVQSDRLQSDDSPPIESQQDGYLTIVLP